MSGPQRIRKVLRLCLKLISAAISSQGSTDVETKRLIYRSFSELGGVYIKFLQLLSLNVDFLRGWAGPGEMEVFENVAPEPLDIHRLLRNELGDEKLRQFKTIDPAPFAAGSFAQVYLARLQDDSQVILKVLRPTQARHLKLDLKLIRLITRIIWLVKPMTMIDISTAYRDFAATTLAETDYPREVRSALWFETYFKDQPGIKIPHTYQQLSTTHIITQEYIGGLSLAEVLKAKNKGEDAEKLVSDRLGSKLWAQFDTLGTAMLRAAFWADFLPGDLHPGNIKLLPDNRVGLIDFGIVATSPTNRIEFLELVEQYQKLYEDRFDASGFTIAALKFFDAKLVSAMEAVGSQLFAGQRDEFIDKIGRAAAKQLDIELSTAGGRDFFRRKRIMLIFGTMINDQNRLGIKLDLESANMMKAASTYLQIMGIFAQTGENLDTMSDVMSRVTTEVRDHITELRSAPKATQSFEYSIEVIANWLSKVADTDPSLYRQLTANMDAYGYA